MAMLQGLQDEYVIAVVVGTLATWFAHSSLSIVLLVMSFAGSGLIEPKLALALVIGANIGGALAPYMAQSGADVAARRVPLANLMTRAIVGVALLPFLGQAVDWLTLVDASTTRLPVNFHTAFNVLAVAGLPAAGRRRRLGLPPPAARQAGPRRSRQAAASRSQRARFAGRGAGLRAARDAEPRRSRGDMLRQTIDVLERNDPKAVKAIEAADNAVDQLYEAIKLYLVQVSRNELGEEDGRRYVEILTFTTNLEHIGDIIDKNLMELAAKKIRNRYAFSAEGMAELRAFHARVLENLRLALNVFTTRDITLARRLVGEKASLREAESRAADSHFARLREGRTELIETSSIHMDVIRDLKRINGHLASVAYPILEAAGELADTRLKTGSPSRRRRSAGPRVRTL